MSNELLREALEIGLKYAKCELKVAINIYRGSCIDAVKDEVRKIEAAIASLDMYATATHAENVSTEGENSDTSPAFNQSEFDTMVEKGTAAWAEDASGPDYKIGATHISKEF